MYIKTMSWRPNPRGSVGGCLREWRHAKGPNFYASGTCDCRETATAWQVKCLLVSALYCLLQFRVANSLVAHCQL